jgi:hypothetical protein
MPPMTGQTTGSLGKSDEQVTLGEQTDGLLLATKQSNTLSEGGPGTLPTSPRKGRVVRSPRRAEDSPGNRPLESILGSCTANFLMRVEEV